MAESFKTVPDEPEHHLPMTIDLDAAMAFTTTHARILDRRRMRLLLGSADTDGVLDALDGYRNPDGGYGWGLEPDLRSTESQPAAALHAFEVFAEAAPTVSPATGPLCDWLGSISRPDGGLPFALAVSDPAGCAPFWVQADPDASSLQITAVVAANAHRVARHDPVVATHPWLDEATRFCIDAIGAMEARPHAYELGFAMQFIDAAVDQVPNVETLLARLDMYLPGDGTLPVEGGLEDEMLRPLDYAPYPGCPVRDLLAADVIERDLDRLDGQQQPDGGWPVDWQSASPAAALEWRGYLTVRAVKVLMANARTSAADEQST